MRYLQEHVSAKLLLSYIAVLLVGAVVLLFVVLFTAQGAYSRHMQMIDGNVMGNGTHLPGWMASGQGSGQGLNQGAGFVNFRAGVLEALGYALIAAVMVAVMVSVILSRQIVAPLQAMIGASQRIADGQYDKRVNESGADEVAQLAQRFNRMAERLQQTETMRRQLIGDVSHELRTPLTAIGGYMEGLVDGVLPASTETFEQVRGEVTRLSRLVDDLQELSRVESGTYKLEIRAVKLALLVDTTSKRLAHQFSEKNVTLNIGVERLGNRFSDLPFVLADEDRIIQVMMNLLANALTYTQMGGVVDLSAAVKGKEVWVSVKDNGIGISDENLAHVFDRFYRVDKSRSRAAGGGSGIGLTIAKAIVESHGGRIWAESTGEGRGSRFTFTLKTST